MFDLSQNIFRDYDIRGVYPEEINKEAAFEIGRLFADYTHASRVLVGRDMRLSSDELFQSLVRGLIERGVEVLDAGLVPIDFIYSMTAKNNFSAGVMITASHNPPEYNGFKMVVCRQGKIEILGGKEIFQSFNQEAKESRGSGQIKSINLWSEYLNHLFSLVDLKQIRPLKIVVDAGNGLAGKVVPLLAQKMPIQIIPRFFDLDGRFPNRPSNPLANGVLENLGRAVVEFRADFGVAFDGDADRIFMVDEKGEPLTSSQVTMLLAKELLVKSPGEAIIYASNLSRALPDLILSLGGRPILSRVGYRFVSQVLRKNNGLMSGEYSGHFAFCDNFYTDSGFLALLIILEAISRDRQSLSQIVKPYKIYYQSPEMSIPSVNVSEQSMLVRKKYQAGQINEFDGLTIGYPDWWFNLRPSHTENNILRLIVEGKTKELVDAKKAELAKILQINSKT